MIRNIKGNNLLKKYQDGTTITTPTVSPNAIAFTSGFETNRGYANNGYTSSTESRNMSNDYAYILADLPEPLQVILLDAVHNQSNLPGTMVLTLAKNNPTLYQNLINSLGGSENTMGNVIMLGNTINNIKAYEGKGTKLSQLIDTIKPEILKAYNENPKKFIDDFTKSRIERNSSFGNKNTSVIQGSNNKMEEWAERSIAASEYAKDLIDGDAETPDYYYDINKNQNVFKQQIKPIVDFTLNNDFPGDNTPESKDWYDEINDVYDNETKTIQNNQKDISNVTQVEESNLNKSNQKNMDQLSDGIYTDNDGNLFEVKTLENNNQVFRMIGYGKDGKEVMYPESSKNFSVSEYSSTSSTFKPYKPTEKINVDEVDNTKTTESPKNINTKPEKNVIVNTKYPSQYTPLDKNYGVDKQTVYYDHDTDKYHIIEGDTKWEVDETGEKIKDTNEVLNTQEKNKFLTNIFVLDGPGDEPVDQRSIEQSPSLRTVGNVLNKGVEKIDKLLRDKNPYRDDTYGPIKDKNKELREERKAARQKNQAVRRTGREMKKKFNILEDIERIDQNRLKQSARAEKRAKKAYDELQAQEKIGSEKADKAVANIEKRDRIQSEIRKGQMERKAEIAELDKKIAQSEKLLRPEEIENKQKIKTFKKKNRLTQRENIKNKQITNRVKRLKEEREKLEQKEINPTPLFGDMDRLEEELEEKKYGGKLKYKTGGNLIKYQNGNSISKNPIKGKHKIRMTEKQYEDYMEGALLDSIDDDGTPIYRSLSDLPQATVNAHEDYITNRNLIGGFNALKKKRERDRYVRDRDGKLLFKKPPKEYISAVNETTENISRLGDPFMYNNPNVPFTNVLNLANNAFNPFSWANSLNKVGKNIKSGNYKNATINTIDAIPGAGGPLKMLVKEAGENTTLDEIRNFKSGGNLIKYQIGEDIVIPTWSTPSLNSDGTYKVDMGGGYSTPDGVSYDPSGRPGRFINETFKTKAEELEDAINYNKQYSAYDPYSLMRPSHKMSDAANWGVTGYNLALASQAPEKTPIFMKDYTPLRQYAPVNFMPATKQYAIGRRAIAQNARGTGTLMGNLQQLNANILDKKIDIAERAADKQLGFDRAYETAKEKIAKEFKDQKMNQYYKDLEHRSAKQNALTEAVSKWNKQQQTKAKYIQAENSDVNKIRTYVNQLSADYKVKLDKDGMAHVIHNKTGKKDRQKTMELNMQRRSNLTNEINQVMELMKNEKDENKIIQYRQRIDALNEQLNKVGFYTGANYAPKVEDAVTNSSKIETSNKRGGNIKSKKTVNILMDGGYTPRNKRQKKLRTKLY
jgi:hypothetical protein